MNQKMRSSICLLSFITILLLSACSGVRVSTSHGFMGPDTFIATDGKVEVRYGNGQCCCVMKRVLQSLAQQANSGEFEWSQMSNKSFSDRMIKKQCEIELSKGK